MDARRFYSVAYDARNHPKVQMLRRWGDGLVEYARWQVLLAVMYDQGSSLQVGRDWYDPETGELTGDPTLMAEYLADQMELDLPGLLRWLDAAADVGLIVLSSWKTRGTVTVKGVADEINYKNERREAGKKGGRPKKKADED